MKKLSVLVSRPAAFGRWLLMITVLLLGAQTLSAQESQPVRVQPPAGAGNLALYLPLVRTSLPRLTLNPISRPNSNNQWTASWTAGVGVNNYELQESHDAAFSTVATYAVTTTSQLVQKFPSLDNTYYYRVRPVAGSLIGDWSNVQFVMGGYRDDFDNPDSGWTMRRTTFLKRIIGIYLNGTYQVEANDGYDWGIFSPLRPAPAPPYVIEYSARAQADTPLASHGAVVGGDWNGEDCPDYSTLQGLYEHEICFNHFYNTNLIRYIGSTALIKLIFERVDQLVWCPGCGGSPMKRLSDDEDIWVYVDPVPNISANDWNVWRVEVRSDGITLFANGQEYAHMADSTYVNDPYFGLFVSSSELEPSHWRVEYYQVTYLDN